MNKIWLIIKREYLTRVRNKTFLLSTFLLPIVMMLFIFGSAFFAMSSKEKLKKIHDEQAELYDGSEGALEESFLKQFGSFGITIYKADPLLTKWSKVELNPTTKKANLVPCT